jgi:hypothetical protein
VAGVVQQRCGVGFAQARQEALAHQLPLAVPAVRVEAVADDRLAIADHVGDDRNQAQRHLAEVNVRIADGRTDRKRFLADVDDLHGWLLNGMAVMIASTRQNGQCPFFLL